MRRAAVATRALAARVNLWTVRPTTNFVAASFPRPTPRVMGNPFRQGRRIPPMAHGPKHLLRRPFLGTE